MKYCVNLKLFTSATYPETVFCVLQFQRILGKDEQGENMDLKKVHPNPFIRSVAYWMLKDYSNSLNTLLQTDATLGIHHPDYVARKSSSASGISAGQSCGCVNQLK